MNKEVHYEGWLIKSPPTKRIWRARWRRRWFTLKQGEIPEQFCLEYYTDRNCRKLKGVIDLDQCEQVDCGLRLENRKQKFQFMFDIKTPKRTYYLAADTEADMRDWVNCICQVCHLLDTKQSGEMLQDQNRLQNAVAATPSGAAASLTNSFASATSTSSTSTSTRQASFGNEIQLRRPIVLEQPQSGHAAHTHNYNNNNKNNNNNSLDCPYVNAEYSNRETLLCDMRFDQQQLAAAATSTTSLRKSNFSPLTEQTSPGGGAIYLNSTLFGAKQQQQQQQQQQKQTTQQHDVPTDKARLAVNANGVVRKIPENLVLSNVSLPDMLSPQQQQQQQQAQQQAQLPQQDQKPTHSQYQTHQYSVQPSPALSTASGPYIPISECFSGSPKLTPDSNNPTTPLNNLDPKFYDTPRSHNNIGLNLTNDQSYSPKITNCSLQQQPQTSSTLNSSAANKSRCHRSDSDSESVFTDDDEWTHPLPLRENVDRSMRPSDSSVENESFVLTYSQRFSKVPDSSSSNNGQNLQQTLSTKIATVTAATTTAETKEGAAAIDLELKALKNKKNLILDIQKHEKTSRDLPQLSDTENTSPAIGPRDATSVVEESYDIPRSHNLPYYNMGKLYEKSAQGQSPDTNPIAASTPNLLTRSHTEFGAAVSCGAAASISMTTTMTTGTPAHVRTLPRPHCYTNAAPTKFEGNVFRYDFVEQGDLPPVNRKLKPKANLEDKPPEEVPAKPPISMTATPTTTATTIVTNAAALPNTPSIYDNLANRFLANLNIQSPIKTAAANSNNAQTTTTIAAEQATISATKPPSVDRKLKPNAYKTSNVNTRLRLTSSSSLNRSSGAPLSLVLPNDIESYVMETRTLPRQPRINLLYDTNLEHHNIHPYHHHHSHSLGSGTTSTSTSAIAVAFGKDTLPTSSLTTALVGGGAAAGSSHQQQQQQQQTLQKSPSQILHLPAKNEHKLQYFDLDMANPPQINRQSMSVSNLNAPGGVGANRANMSADPSVRAPAKSGVVYNYVDFVKTEAFKRIREERKKESEGGGSEGNVSSGAGGTSAANFSSGNNK